MFNSNLKTKNKIKIKVKNKNTIILDMPIQRIYLLLAQLVDMLVLALEHLSF